MSKTATATKPKTKKAEMKEQPPPSMPKKKDAPKEEDAKPLSAKERNKKAQRGQILVDTLEHRLTGAKAHVKELTSQLEQAKKKLREDILDLPQGEFGFNDGGNSKAEDE